MHAIAVLCCLLLPAVPRPGLAETTMLQEEIAVAGWGAEHPECREWTDSCVICQRGSSQASCSTPGIACVPTPTVCKATAPP